MVFKLTNKYNQIALNQKDYKSEEEFWNTVRDLTKILLNARYEIECYWDGEDIYIFNFNLDHRYYNYGVPYIKWIDPSTEDIVPIEEE